MTWLIVGLILFVGGHSIKAWGGGVRAALIARLGEGPFKGLYSIVALLGLVLAIWGYQVAAQSPSVWYGPPAALRHPSTLLVLVAFILAAAAYVPDTHLRAWTGHPLLLGTGLWSVAHLIANGTDAAVVLFGGFLAWVLISYPSALGRDRREGRVHPPGRWAMDLVAVATGAGLWVLMAFWAHRWLFGVGPFG